MSIRPNMRAALRDVAILVLVLLAFQIVFLALDRVHDWWVFVVLVVVTVPIRLAVMLRKGSESKPEDAPGA